jgi:hypothetical protein
MAAIDAPHAALYGALIGSLGGVLAQICAQGLTAWRGRVERARIEQRTVHAFRGILVNLEETVRSVPPYAKQITREMIEPTVIPLRNALDRPDFYLGLQPTQITAMFGVLDSAEAVLIALQLLHTREDAEELLEIQAVAKATLSSCDAAANALGMPPFRAGK